MKEATAQKAAKWWADHIRNGAPLDNGDTSETGLFTMLMAIGLQDRAQKAMPPTAVDKFEEALKNSLIANTDLGVTLMVDYHPCGLLSDALDKSGIKDTMTALPWKTSMWIDGDKITFRLGYGAPERSL